MVGESHSFVERAARIKPREYKPWRLNFGTFSVNVFSAMAVLFLVVPLLVLVVRGLSAGSFEGVAEAVLLSLITTLITSAVTILFGTPLAYVLARSNVPLKPLIQVLVELPIVLPPAVAGLPLKLVLVARRQAEGSHAFDLDYLTMLALDGYRRYLALVPLSTGGQLVDDPLGTVAAIQAGSGWLASHLAFGASLELVPGVGQRLTFIHDQEGGAAPVECSLLVRAWYRPGRHVL